jgi:hypothetical protein
MTWRSVVTQIVPLLQQLACSGLKLRKMEATRSSQTFVFLLVSTKLHRYHIQEGSNNVQVLCTFLTL